MRSIQRVPLFYSSRCMSLSAVSSKKRSTGASKGSSELNDWASASKEATLVIVESPAKARTIQKFVDSNTYIIDSCAGHIRELVTAKSKAKMKAPSSSDETSSAAEELKKKIVSKQLRITVGSLGIDVFNDFKAQYVPSEGKNDIRKRLKGLSKSATRILLATDEDREGEAISWHLLEVLKPTVPYKVCWFQQLII